MESARVKGDEASWDKKDKKSAPRKTFPAIMNHPSVLLRVFAAAIGVAAYANALHNPFVYDDTTEILENASIRDLSDLRFVLLGHSLTRPVTNLSYAIDYAFWGLNAFGYHLTNLLLHALNVVLLFTLVRDIHRDVGGQGRMNDGSTFAGFTASGLFAVHPMMTEAVGYATGRTELLVATFVLASLYWFRRGLLSQKRLPVVVGIILAMLALGTKETAVIVPFVLLTYDVLILHGRRREERARRLWRVHLPLVTTILVAAAVRIWLYMAVEYPTTSGFRWPNLLADVEVLSRYISLLFMPIAQSFVHGSARVTSFFDVSLFTAIGVLTVVISVAVIARRDQPLVTLGIVWLLIALLPGVALVLLGDIGQPMAERRAYLASCGFFLSIAAGATSVLYGEVKGQFQRSLKIGTVLAVALVSLFVLTVRRNQVWSDPVRLWSDAVSKAPGTWLAQFGLADAYQSVGDCESALSGYRRAIALIPENPQAYDGLAACLVELQRPDDARRVLRAAIVRVPSATLELLTLALLEEQAHNWTEALRLCQEASKLAPGNRAAQNCIERTKRVVSAAEYPR
jgi:protein O-mannosyl-transferase